MIEDKFYFSNVPDSERWDTNPYLNVVLVPSNWWSVTAWKLAFEFNKNVECVYLGIKKSRTKW